MAGHTHRHTHTQTDRQTDRVKTIPRNPLRGRGNDEVAKYDYIVITVLKDHYAQHNTKEINHTVALSRILTTQSHYRAY